MAAPSVTYTFSNSTTADATQVNQNFSDVINGLSDGTKDLSINALTCAGTATLNGNVNIGNSSGDDLSITASLAQTLSIKTNNTYDIGSATLGLAGVYLGAAGGFTTRLKAAASSSWTMTFPATAGSNYQYLETDGSGNGNWRSLRKASSACDNYSLAASVATNALTITLNASSGSAPSSTDPVEINFRNSTTATGTSSLVRATSALTLTISSGSTLGHASGVDSYIFVYAINNAGTMELAASTTYFDEGQVVSTTAEGGGGAADSNRVMYSTTARSNVACRLLGMMVSNQVTSGTWAAVPTRISLPPVEIPPVVVEYQTAAGQSLSNSTTTRIDFGTKVIDNYNCVATGGWTFTAPKAMYVIVSAALQFGDTTGTGTAEVGIAKNGTEVHWGYYQKLSTSSGKLFVAVTDVFSLAAGDTIWASGFQSTGGSLALTSSALYNYISIHEIAGRR